MPHKFASSSRLVGFGALIAALMLGTTSASHAREKKPLSFGELQTIRGMAGGTVGEALGTTLPKPHLAILANRPAIRPAC
jgi:hypothetical protein